ADKAETREVSWRQLLPWTELFRGFQIALDLNKLLLAAGGILVTAFGWWLLAVIFSTAYDKSPPAWPGNYKTKAKGANDAEKDANAWRAFKADRDSWNLMHRSAGLSDEPMLVEPEDLADTPDEVTWIEACVPAMKGGLEGKDKAERKLSALTDDDRK